MVDNIISFQMRQRTLLRIKIEFFEIDDPFDQASLLGSKYYLAGPYGLTDAYVGPGIAGISSSTSNE